MNIGDRLKAITYFPVRPDFSRLTEAQKKAIKYCLDTTDLITDVYLDQSFRGNKRILKDLQKRTDQDGKDLLNYFKIFGCPWDEFNHNEPIIPGIGERPKFGSFYPDNFTKEEFEKWIKLHPEDKVNFQSNYTVLKRENDRLIAVPYSVEYKDRLEQISSSLKLAANLVEGTLKDFLSLRAESFLSNDYFESELAWVDTVGSPFEITIGPYEVYNDELLGLKTSFESLIAIPNKEASESFQKFISYVPDYDLELCEKYGVEPNGNSLSIEVVDDVMRAGEMAFGNLFLALSLPNDRRIHALKGSKKILSKTMMEANYSATGVPIAEKILSKKDLEKFSFEARLDFILCHEIAHAIGPQKTKSTGKETGFEIPLGGLNSTIEEVKADMIGTSLLRYFRDLGLITDDVLFGAILSELVFYFQHWRHGYTRAHSKGNLISYNWMRRSNCLQYNRITGEFEVNPEECIASMSELGEVLLGLQVAGDYNRAKNFVDEFSRIPPEAPEILSRLTHTTTSIRPIWDLSGLK